MKIKEIFESILNNLKEMVPNLKSKIIAYDFKLYFFEATSIESIELIEKTLEVFKCKVNNFRFRSINNLDELKSLFFQKVNTLPYEYIGK